MATKNLFVDSGLTVGSPLLFSVSSTGTINNTTTTFNYSIVGTITTATNIAGGTAGAITYQIASGILGFIGTGTTGQVLTMSANTATWQAPTSGPASNITGGTAGALHYQVAPGITDFIGTGTTGSILQMGANTATWVTTSSIQVLYATTTTNIAGGTAGAITYQTAPGTIGFIGTGTTGQVLTMGANTATWATAAAGGVTIGKMLTIGTNYVTL